MRYSVALILCCLVTQTLKAQQYRINYERDQLPELYQAVNVFVEENTGNSYKKPGSNAYRLSTTEGQLKGRQLTFDRRQVYQNKGIVHFTVYAGGREYPAQLILPVLKDIRFNLYTDSIKPILNYWVNLEGVFNNDKVLPLDTNFATISSDHGRMKGTEWIVPDRLDFDRVKFTAVSKLDPAIRKEVTVFLKKYKDPRDDPHYQDRSEEDVINDRRRK